jgi:hypothetical protein
MLAPASSSSLPMVNCLHAHVVYKRHTSRYQTVRDAVCSLARLQPIHHRCHQYARHWRSMGISGRSRRGAELNWVASMDVGLGLVYGGTRRYTLGAPDTM